MFTSHPKNYSRCFISAPFAMTLGVLPVLLGERQIAWNWASDTQVGSRISLGLERCDFMIAVLNGTQSDYRVLYESGIAEGLGKPVLYIATSKRVSRAARSQFPLVDVKLTESVPLRFQLDAFLATPHETIFERERVRQAPPAKILPPSEKPSASPQPDAVLERRVFEAVVGAGGSAIAEPVTEERDVRPDLLIWLPSEDPELLDPAVVEVKRRVAIGDVKRAEQQLLKFISSSGVKCGFLLTEDSPLEKRIALSPYIFWLSIDHFIELTATHRLGAFIRRLRNQAAHGDG